MQTAHDTFAPMARGRVATAIEARDLVKTHPGVRAWLATRAFRSYQRSV